MKNTLVLGTFDGVHRAHRALVDTARKVGGEVTVCTFDRPPAMLFMPETRFLTDEKEKTARLKAAGADQILLQNFDEKLAAVTAEAYIENLCDRYHPAAVVVGFNHRFGALGAGTCATLSALGKKMGFETVVVPPVTEGQTVISSTLIRQKLAEGDTDTANRLLGYRYEVSGTVVHGRHLGSAIGFPTANLQTDPRKLLPDIGVYATFCEISGRTYKGMTNIGVNPTVGENNALTVETHLLGTERDCYGQKMTVRFVKKIRDDQVFPSLDALKEQLGQDALLTDRFLQAVRINEKME